MCLVVGKSLVPASTVDAWCPGRDGKCQVTETPRRKYTKLQQSGTRGYVTRTVSLLLTPVTCEELAVVTHSLNYFFGQPFLDCKYFFEVTLSLDYYFWEPLFLAEYILVVSLS